MSILSKLTDLASRAAPASPAPSAEIETRLRAAQAAIPTLEVRHADVSYRAEIGDASDDEAASALAELRAARDRVASLSAALKRSREVEATKAADARNAFRGAQINAYRQHRAKTVACMNHMAQHLADAIAEFDAALKAAEKAIGAAPVQLPLGCKHSPGELRELTANEIYRLSAKLIARNKLAARQLAFPGGQSPDFRLDMEPERIVPLADVLASGTQFALSVLNGTPVAPIPASVEEIAPAVAPLAAVHREAMDPAAGGRMEPIGIGDIVEPAENPALAEEARTIAAGPKRIAAEIQASIRTVNMGEITDD
jgi:hypothetical protein